MDLIGINGFKRSGKGTVAEIVTASRPDENVKSVGFADKLKLLAAHTLGYDDLTELQAIALMDQFKEDGFVTVGISTMVTTITGRQYLQNLGNNARNLFGDSFWIDQVLPNPVLHEGWVDNQNQVALAMRYPDVDVLCVTDVRYPNEAKRIKALGGVVWEVRRPGTASDGHVSETPLDESLIDWQIDNDGSYKLLRDRVFLALQEASVPA